MKYSYTILGALAASVSAHTWVEQLNVITANGTMGGQPGFPRGNVKRGTPGFGDPAMVNLMPPNTRAVNDIRADDPICKDSQLNPTQTDGSPRLQAAAGANVALRYQENGHVSLPDNQPGKPPNRGTVYVYGTTQAKSTDALLSIHRVWTADGKGGDGRGVLLATRDYDDGQCYQVNGGEISTTRQKTFAHVANTLQGGDLWCQTDVQIPSTAQSGQPYTLYWVWDWPTMPGTPGFPDGKQEIYTTCMDVDIAGGPDTNNKAATAAFAKGQDLGNAAVAAQFADIANPTAVTGQFIPFAAASGAASGGAAASPPTASGAAGSTAVATTTAPVGTSTVPAPSSPAQPSQSGNGGDPNTSFRTRTRGRPNVSPIGSTSAPLPQPTGGSPVGSDNNGQPGVPAGSSPAASGFATTSSTTPAANTGTAIAGPSTTTATVTAPASTSVVTQLQTVVNTIKETIFQTVSKRAEPTQRCSTAEAAYRLRARSPYAVAPSNDADADC